MRRSALLALIVLALPLCLLAAFPTPDGYVTDAAAILDAPAETALEAQLAALERETSAEVAVATVTSLDGMSIEEYANRLFAEWAIGKKQKDNGVLLLVAPTDREVRIEVGYGLEGVLTDGLAGEIIRADLIPAFRAGDFPGGIQHGVDRIALVVRRDPAALQLGSGSAIGGSEDGDRGLPEMFLIVPFFSVFVGLGLFAVGLGVRTKTIGPLIWGGMFGGMPLLLFTFAFSSSVAWTAVMAALALGTATIGFRKGRAKYWIDALRTTQKGGSSDNGLQMGGSSGGSGGSGGSSGGGGSSSSSFGGGSSGGGGASGRW